MRRLRTKIIVLTIVALSLSICTTLMAQTNYPNKPLRLIVPMPPGGSNDILGRMIAKGLSAVVGQQVIVDNRPGAGGEVGATMAAHAAPDGYNLLLGSIGNLAHNPALKPDLPYDPVRDFAPVVMLATMPFALVVNPSLPVANVKELIALAKAKPATLNYGTAGYGSSNHMAAEFFKYLTGTDMVHVAYKGGAPGYIELMSGQIQLWFTPLASAISLVRAGKLRAIAVTTKNRAAVLPNVPTVVESGVEGYVVQNWQGIVLPRQTPPEIVKKLNRDLITAIKQPDMAEALKVQGFDPFDEASGTPEAFGELIKSEITKYKQVVKMANIETR